MPNAPGPDEPTRVLIIGAGKMGSQHGRAFAALPGVDLVGVASRHGESASRLAHRLGIAHASDDWRALADRLEPHACIVAVSHTDNEAVTRAVLEAGCHVLAEKPVAFSSEAALRLAELAQDKSLIAMAAMNRRFYSSVLAALEEVRYVGRLIGITAFAPDPVRPRRAIGRHEPFVYDRWTIAQTIHLIDLLRLAAGELDEVLGVETIESDDPEANFAALMRFSTGTVVSYISFSSSGGAWELRFHGTSLEVRLGPLETGTVRVGARTRKLPGSTRTRRGLAPGVGAQAFAFVDALQSGGPLQYPASSLDDHARSIALAELIEEFGQGSR